MKNAVCSLVICLAFLFLSFPAVNAQERTGAEDVRYVIKTNPLSALGGPFWFTIIPLTGEYKLLFEAAVSDKSSVQFGAGYIGPSVLLNLDDLTNDNDGSISGINTNGFRVQGMYKFYISRDLKAPEGFYIGPHISYAMAQIKNRDNNEKSEGTKINVNGVFGYQLITSGGFSLDIYTGLGFVSRQWKFSGAQTDWDEDVFKDRASVNVPLGFTFGFAF